MNICDLPHDLVGEKILTKVPITSLKAVRSTCKLWDALSREYAIGKAEARRQFLGFMMKDLKFCSVRFDLRKKDVDLSIKPVDLFDGVEISKVFYCDGLVLCVVRDFSRLVVWNPYLGQTRSIVPRTNFNKLDRYGLGYDINRNHKVLRFIINHHMTEIEIYDFSSSSWRVLEVTPPQNRGIMYNPRGVSLKGFTYFFCQLQLSVHYVLRRGDTVEVENFLLCFDFTTERFGPHLPTPFECGLFETVSLSCVREEQLALICFQRQVWSSGGTAEIWVTTKIEPNSMSWNMFFLVDIKPLTLTGVHFLLRAGSFFIDEEEKVAVVFDIDGHYPVPTGTPRYNTAFILPEDGCFKSVRLGEALNLGVFADAGDTCHPLVGSSACIPLVCSSAYFPSLVQVEESYEEM